MRTAFIETLCELAETDDRIWLLTGDLGYSVLERFAQRFPTRYVNVGVAEQNMTGVAAGLALSGKIVFTYSIANFPVMRCLEQVRNDVCYHNLDVKIVAVGGGLAYGAAGYTHHAVEDLAVMRVMPNLVVVAPGDPTEVKCATRAIAAQRGPSYLRLGKGGALNGHAKPFKFHIGQALLMLPGDDVTLISTGGMLPTVLKAAEMLSGMNYSVRVLSMPTIQPIDRDAIREAAVQTRGIVTAEEHGVGGLFSAVAEVLATDALATPFKPLYLHRQVAVRAGSQITLREEQGLSVSGIVEAVRTLID
jgi:transketolase